MAQVNPLMFRAYDIRGLVDDDLTEEAAQFIGQGIGSYLQQRGGKRLVVGRDNRSSSERLKNKLVEGLLATGCDVVDIGQSPSPLMYAAACFWNMDGGVNVTGSHNPPEYNGFKVVGPQAYPIGGDEIMQLRDLVLAGSFAAGQGQYSERDARPEYFAKIESAIRLARPIKVVIDTGNGVAGLTVPPMLKKLGCELVELYTELDGRFPHHLPDPEKESYMTDLKKRVVECGAELGIGFDGDGDRLGLVDENGNFMEADYVVMLLARDYLSRHPGEKVVIDIKASRNTLDYIQRHGGVPIMWKTGHSLIKQKMRQDKIGFGGELSGHMFMFEDYYPIDDGLFAACRVLQFLSQDTKKLSEYFADLPKLYSTHLIELRCDDAVKFDVIKQVQAAFLARYEVNTIDGARVNMPGGWALVRASNTGPKIALRFEAETPERLEEIRREVMATVNQFMPKP